MSETVRWDKVKRKIWLKQTWEKTKMKAVQAGNWVIENPIAAVTILGTCATLVGKAGRIYTTHAEDVRRRRDFYDPRTGKHTNIKRDLKGWEAEEVDERYNNGESYVKIFRSMNLMK